MTKEPQIGDWWAACCQEDLQRIDSSEDLDDVRERIELGEPDIAGVWATREEALSALFRFPMSPPDLTTAENVLATQRERIKALETGIAAWLEEYEGCRDEFIIYAPLHALLTLGAERKE